MEILYILLVLLLVTRVFGEVAIRLNQPALVGELVSGIVLGAIVGHQTHLFPILSDLTENPVFRGITDLGIFFLMLLAGIEMRPRDMAKASTRAFLVALGGLLLPLATGFGLAWLVLPSSEAKVPQALFIGTALSITAVPVAVKVLMDLDLLNTKTGKVIVSAAVYDDIFSLVVLAVLTSFINTGSLPDAAGFAKLLGSMAVFMIVLAIGWKLIPRLGKLIQSFQSDELEFSFLLVLALAYSVLAEVLGLHFILGAFAAGLFFSCNTVGSKAFKDVENKVSGITTGFLAPVFFASIGFHLKLEALTAVPLFLGLLIAIAFLTKLLGTGVPAWMSGLGTRASVCVGIAMSARGAVELIIADIALQAGLFDYPELGSKVIDNMFSAIVIVAVVTTLAVPILMKLWLTYTET